MSLNILIVQPALAPYRVDFFNDVAGQISRVHFFFYMEQMISQSISIKEFNIRFNFTIGTKRKFKKWRPILIAILVLPKLFLNVLKTRTDVIITNEFGLISLLVSVYCKLSGRRHIVWTDDSLDNAMRCGRFRKLRRDFVLSLSDRLIVCNSSVRNYYESFLPYKIEAVEILQKEGVFRTCLQSALPVANEYIKKYNLRGRKVVLFVGRLTGVKNLHTLIEAFSQTDNQAVLVVVGSGELDDELRFRVTQYGIADRVIFTGRQCSEALWAWYLIGGLFVLPSTSERFGAVVNEALLAGMPVLCSRFAGASCLIKEEVNGVVFEPTDTSALPCLLREQLKEVSSLSEIERVRDSLMEHHYKDALNRFLMMCSI